MDQDYTPIDGELDGDGEFAQEVDTVSSIYDVQKIKSSLLNHYNELKAAEITKSINHLMSDYHQLDADLVHEAILKSINGLAEQWELALRVKQTPESTHIQTSFAVELPILLNEQMPKAFRIKDLAELNKELRTLLWNREQEFREKNINAHPTCIEEIMAVDDIPSPPPPETEAELQEEPEEIIKERELRAKWKTAEYQKITEILNQFYSHLGGVFIEFANLYGFIRWLFEARSRRVQLLAILKYIEYIWIAAASFPANNLVAMRNVFQTLISGIRNIYGEFSQFWIDTLRAEKEKRVTAIPLEAMPETIPNPKASTSTAQTQENPTTKNPAEVKVATVNVLGKSLIITQADLDSPAIKVGVITENMISLCHKALKTFNSAIFAARKIKFDLTAYDFGRPVTYSPALDMFDQYISVIAPQLAKEAKEFKAKWPKLYIQFNTDMYFIPDGLGLGKPIKEIFLSAAEMRDLQEKEKDTNNTFFEETSSEVDSHSETSMESFEDALFTQTEETHSNSTDFTEYEDESTSTTTTAEISQETDRQDGVDTKYNVEGSAGGKLKAINLQVKGAAERKAHWNENKKAASKNTTSNSESLNAGWENAINETATKSGKVSTNALSKNSREVNRKREIQLQKKYSTNKEQEKEHRDNRSMANRNQDAGLLYLLLTILQKYKIFVSVSSPILFKKIGRDVDYIPLDQLEAFLQENVCLSSRETVKKRIMDMLENTHDFQGRVLKFTKGEAQFAINDSYADLLKTSGVPFTLKDQINGGYYHDIPGILIDETSIAMVTDSIFPIPILTNSTLSPLETKRLEAEIASLQNNAEKQRLVNKTLKEIMTRTKDLQPAQLADVLIALAVSTDSEFLQKIGMQIKSHMAKLDTSGSNLPLFPFTEGKK